MRRSIVLSLPFSQCYLPVSEGTAFSSLCSLIPSYYVKFKCSTYFATAVEAKVRNILWISVESHFDDYDQGPML
jgi:hypothetical protein